jgi:PAS domain S-box-containing protein
MAQEPIEMILLTHWASYVAVPIWITDAEGNLIFYNESAERILGRSFEDAGEVKAEVLGQLFETTSLDGEPIPNEELPLVVALTEQRPSHRSIRIRAFDGSWRVIDITAIPITGQGGRHLGAMATFWEQ